MFIPWAEIEEIVGQTRRYGAIDEIRARRAPEVPFGLRKGTFNFIRENAPRAGVRGNYPR